MKYLNQLMITVLLFASSLCAQEYAVDRIPKKLTEEAFAVVRADNTRVELISQNKLKLTDEIVITVLNETGLGYAFQPIYYDKRMNISKYTAVLYDKNGKEIKKLRSKDQKDVSVSDGYSLFIDNRMRYYEFTPASYPFTIKYQREFTTSNTMMFPGWLPVVGYNLGVESSTYEMVNSTSIEIRKTEKNFEGWNVNKIEQGNKITYSIKNLEPIQEEILSPVLSELTPRLMAVPNKIQLEGVSGSFENWEQFGKWYYNELLKDKRELSEKDKQTVLQLIDGVDDPVEKVRILYSYMQSKTRYVNVSIGIGGWEPFPATYVSDKSYGDCKALSNYMISLLNFAGIEAFYTIVNSNLRRKQDMDEKFASLQGNHVIVNVPLDDEIIWLECTSQQSPFNYLGFGTDDRYAVSVRPEGAEIISTQKFPAEKNIEKISGEGHLDANGKINLELKTVHSGLQYDLFYRIYFEPEKEKLQSLRKQYNHLPNLNLNSYDFENDRHNAVFTTSVSMDAENYASVVGNSLMLNLLPAGRHSSSLKKSKDRKHPFEVRFGYTDEIDFVLNPPSGYHLNEKFNDIVLLDRFGSYLLSVKENQDGSLRVQRKLTVKDGVYKKEEFNDYVEFIRKVSSLDNSKILLERK